MIVSELIEKLLKFDGNATVVMPGYEGGYSNVTTVYTEPIKLNVRDCSFYENRAKGEHDSSHNNPDITAVIIQ